MAIEAVKIPQNVYVEDRIIGPVTLKHLIILGIGAAISYVIYAGVMKLGYRDVPVQIACWIPLMIAAGFAFVRINDLSLFNIILLTIESANKPNVRYWSPHQGLSINVITRQTAHELDTAQTKAAETAAKLAEMTRQLERKQEELSRMAGGNTARPEATEAVKTQMQDIIADQAQGPVLVPADETTVLVRGSALPVTKSRIRASALDPALSVDTVAHDLQALRNLSSSPY